MEQKEGPSFGKGETRPVPPRSLTDDKRKQIGSVAIHFANQNKDKK